MAAGDSIRNAAKRIEDRGNTAVRRAVEETTVWLVMGTPVDEGRTRGRWNARIGAEPSGNRSPESLQSPKLYSKEKTLRKRRYATDVEGGNALDDILSQVARWKPSNEKSLFIANASDHLAALSDSPGYSLQPPRLNDYLWLRRARGVARAEFAKVMRNG